MRFLFFAFLVVTALSLAGCSKNNDMGTSAQDYCKRAYQFVDAGYPKEAIDLFDLAIKKDPNFFEAHYNRGVVHFLMKNYQEAIKDFSRALSVEPKNPVVYASRGEVYQTINDSDKALRDYKIAARLGSVETQEYLRSKNISW